MPDKASHFEPRPLPPRPQYSTPVAASQPDIRSVRIERLTLLEMSTPSFFQTHPRVCALILATTKGSRLFPMTSTDNPKHMLPIAGIPSILRLVERLAYLPQLVVAISAEDSTTLPRLRAELGGNDPTEVIEESNPTVISVKGRSQQLIVLKLSPDCFGTVDALREVEETKIVHRSSRLVVFPGDLVFLQKEVKLDPLLRPPSDSDCAILLVDVGEVDEHGIPLKESAKAKKGGLARDEEDLEYIGLSYILSSASMDASAPPPPLPRIVLKQSKMDIEADEDMTGSTAKLQVPKARLRHGKLLVKLSWDDVHVYSLAPWMRELLLARKGLSSLQEDLLPLLIARQFRGKMATFGKSLDQKSQETEENEGIQKSSEEDSPYSVVAVVLEAKAVVRANTVSAYHFACRETVANGERLTMPTDSTWNGKFQTLVLKDTTLGAKINMKSSVVGRGCELGAKCRLNNVVVMDNVIIGENCSLQNTLIGSGAKLGNNCSLNDCQVGPGKEIEAGTKEKGESFMVGDAILDDLF